MRIKWNWGTGILIGIIAFMAFIIGLVYFSVQQNFDLVERDYYPKALEYQQQIDKEENARKLEQQVIVENTGDMILLAFQPFFVPANISGTITFYRPSDKKGDIVFEIETDSLGRQNFPTDILQNGRYIIQINYKVGDTEYYQEEALLINIY
ncbi:MAG TPA: FixH family protein [Bacteroidales bacterium]|nr:FixH family protein [Bacteroidales bacterium]HRX96404.1 FixH family protein [Bacteroidales bacterium]